MNESELFVGLIFLLTVVYFLYRFGNGSKAMKGLASSASVKPFTYSVPVNVNDPSERKLKLYEKDQLMRYLFSDATTLLEALQRGHRQSNNGDCLGRVDRAKGLVEWLSYSEVLCRIKHFGDGLVSLQQKPKQSIIGIFSINRLEYTIAEYGCYWHSMTVAPIYNTLGPDVCTFIANQAEIEVIVCDTLERVQGVLSQATHFSHLKHIVVMEEVPYSYVSKAKNFKLQVRTIQEIEDLGRSKPVVTETHPSSSDDAVICYTSGTTGTPKGVYLTHQNIIASSSGLVYQMFEYRLTKSDVFLSYLPLAHVMERVSEVAHFMVGAKIAYFSGDIQNLTEDIQIVRPTIFLTTPRVLNKIYDKVYANVRGNWLKEWMLRTAIASKDRAYRDGKINNNTVWDKLIMNKVRANLGGRIRVVATGSASLNPKVGDALRSILGCVFLNGYGQTECSGCSMSAPFDKRSDSVGPPLACTTIKLVDIPEMNYFASEGKGEIMVKGPLTSRGYFKNPVETEKLFDQEGWLHTGDVGAWTEEGTLQIIDRKKNFFKLAQGEFIPVEKLEIAYGQSPFVSQIYVYGDSARSFLVAIIVPEKEYLENWCFKNNININYYDQCKDARVKKAILEELRNIAVTERFNKLEYVKSVYMHQNQLTIESGLLTPTMKLKRFEMQRYFGKIIEELYKQE